MDIPFKLIIACEAFRGEVEYYKNQIIGDVVWVEHSLHDYPDRLNQKIKEKVRAAEEFLLPGETILLFFGNCGGAMKNLQSESLVLCYPKVEDCIPVLLGSLEKYLRLQAERKGTFYFNKDWIDSRQDPLGSVSKYVEMYGEEKGWKVSRRMYKNYTHFALINNGCYEVEKYRNHVLEACRRFAKEYVEEPGDLSFIEAILEGKTPMVTIQPRNN